MHQAAEEAPGCRCYFPTEVTAANAASRMTPLERASLLRVRALAALRCPGASTAVVPELETLKAIQAHRASLARFGDGELEIMIGGDTYFQSFDQALARRLRAILRAPDKTFFVGIPNFNGTYHSAFVSRPAGIVNLETDDYFREWERLWHGRPVILIHHSAHLTQHHLFNSAHSMGCVSCPAQNAYQHYDAVLKSAMEHISKPDVLFLIAAGPTAGVLAWDLWKQGAQALDIGHLPAGYDEWMQKR